MTPQNTSRIVVTPSITYFSADYCDTVFLPKYSMAEKRVYYLLVGYVCYSDDVTYSLYHIFFCFSIQNQKNLGRGPSRAYQKGTEKLKSSAPFGGYRIIFTVLDQQMRSRISPVIFSRKASSVMVSVVAVSRLRMETVPSSASF